MFANIIRTAGKTDIGKKRASNQDQFLIADLNKSMLVQDTSLNLESQSRLFSATRGKLFIIADGMGGHQGGKRASRLAIDLLINQLLNEMHWFVPREDEPAERDQDFIDDLKRILQRVHEAIELEALAEADKKGMGTTLTMAYVIWPTLYVLHAGDSRCYLVRDDGIVQLTHDHTVSNQMIEQGGMTIDEANNSPWSNVLYNALGAGCDSVIPEVHKTTLRFGDALLICTDGLYKHVTDAEMRNTLLQEADPHAACRSLVELANGRGGTDNITLIVVRMCHPDEGKHGKSQTTQDLERKTSMHDTIGFPLIEQGLPEDTHTELPDTLELGRLSSGERGAT